MSTISVSNIADGDAVTAASINNQVNTIVNDYNGNVTAANLAANAVTDAKITANNLLATKFSNLYKFRYSLNAAFNTGNGAFSAAVPFDTKQFDTSSNVTAGVFTAPVAGFYQFNWNIVATLSNGANEELAASLFVNGTRTSNSSIVNAQNENGVHGSDTLQLTAAQTVDVRVFNTATRALSVGNIYGNYFSGFLVSSI